MQDLNNILTQKHGQISTVVIERPANLTQMGKNKGAIIKRTKFQCLIGATYDNRVGVISARHSGKLPSKNQGLPWGTWEKFPYIIQHKGQRYFRFYPIGGKMKVKSMYFLNGERLSDEDVAKYVKSSRSNNSKFCLTVQENHVKSIR